MTDFVFRNIDNSAGSATISDHGAHLLRWRPLSQAWYGHVTEALACRLEV